MCCYLNVHFQGQRVNFISSKVQEREMVRTLSNWTRHFSISITLMSTDNFTGGGGLAYKCGRS